MTKPANKKWDGKIVVILTGESPDHLFRQDKEPGVSFRPCIIKYKAGDLLYKQSYALKEEDKVNDDKASI
jgi:hypothetical protein